MEARAGPCAGGSRDLGGGRGRGQGLRTQCALGLYVISSSHLNPELLDPVLRLPAPMPPSPHSPWSLSSVMNSRALHLLAPIFPYPFAYMFVVPRPR